MAERRADYFKQHIWNIIQCLTGCGCLALECAAYRKNQAIQSSAAPTPTLGVAMSPHYAMPWYLWAGITALAFSVIIPAVIGMIRKRRSPRLLEEAIAQARGETKRVKDALYESARSNLEYRGERDQCEKEKRALQKRLDDMFKPLQMDALNLSIELLDFVKGLGPEPTPKYSVEEINSMPESKSRALIHSDDSDYRESCEYHFGEANARNGGPFLKTADQLHASLMAHYRLLNPWYEGVASKYALDFREKVERIRTRFIVEGINDDDDVLLQPIIGRKGPETMRTISAKIWELAYKVGERNQQ